MNIKIAAHDMWGMIEQSNLPDGHAEYGKDHLRYMLDKLILGDVEGEKAHRWLGWVQGCVCVGGGANLETLKKINKAA